MVATKPAKRRIVISFAAVGIILAVSIVLALMIGSVTISAKEVFASLAGMVQSLFGIESEVNGVFRDIRFPRVIIAIIIGINLSLSGVLLQAVMQNPLADPGVTGISSGASVVVVILMLYFPNKSGIIPLAGFIGGIVACFTIYAIAWKKGKITAIRIILSGVAVNAAIGGVTGMITMLNSEKLQGVLTWLNGSLGRVGVADIKTCFLYSIVGLIPVLFLSKVCNILSLGDKSAKSLGFNPNILRLVVSLVGVYLAGISTAFVGIISFIGLIIPHIARLIIGTNHKYLIPFSAMSGAAALLLADLLGRAIAPPIQIPVGIVMSVLGGPFFLYLLRKGDKTHGS